MIRNMDGTTKKTCLYDRHLALGAKMSPFAGYMMPIQYTSIKEEHLAVRGGVGMFDVSHMGEISVSGPDAERYVNHVFTNDVRGLALGKILYGMMLFPDGGTVDDLLVYREHADGHFLLVVNAANTDKDYGWMLEHARGYDVRIEDRSDEWGQLAIQGPGSEKTLVETLGLAEASSLGFYEFVECEWEGVRTIVSRTGYTGEDGFEVYAAPGKICDMWDRLLRAGVVPCGLGCRDTLRFEAGLPLYGDELTAEISPVMAGLSMFCRLDKPEFIGKDALVEQKAGGVPYKLVGLELHDAAVPRAGYAVELEDGTRVGTVTTGYHSISLDKSLCFALLDSAYSALGTALYVRIRKKVFPAEVVRKRFYQTKYKK